jgi:hypothetical protein
VATIRDTIRYKFPSFPKSSRTFVEATLDYQTIISAITPPNIPGSNPVQKERDIERDNILSVKYQLNILRFTNDEVFKNRLKIKNELENYFTKQYEDLECPL